MGTKVINAGFEITRKSDVLTALRGSQREANSVTVATGEPLPVAPPSINDNDHLNTPVVNDSKPSSSTYSNNIISINIFS